MKAIAHSVNKSKRFTNVRPATSPYAGTKLHNSISLAHAMNRSKERAALKNRENISNDLSISLCKINTPSKLKKIRGSKSCAKVCKLDIYESAKINNSTWHNKTRSIAEKQRKTKELGSSSKKIKVNKSKDDAVTTLNKISDALHSIKMPRATCTEYNSMVGSQKKSESNPKFLNNTNISNGNTNKKTTSCMKRKPSTDIGIHNKGDLDSFEVDSAAVINNSIVGKKIEKIGRASCRERVYVLV